MKELVIFLLLHNTPAGQDIVIQSAPMPFEQCDPMQRSVWAIDWPEASHDENGPIPVTDAACVPMSRL